jgi:chemotaxis protein MotB
MANGTHTSSPHSKDSWKSWGSRLDEHLSSPRKYVDNPAVIISYADMMTTVAVFFVMLLSMSDIKTGKFDRLRSEFSGENSGTLVELARELNETIGKTSGVAINLSDDGVRMDLDSAALFDTGEAVLKDSSLERLNPVFRKILQSKYRLDIEGHTDDRGLYERNGGEITTNWSLSGRRASSVALYLINFGFDESRLRIVGYAANKPKVKIDGLGGFTLERARSSNRRVTILVR